MSKQEIVKLINHNLPYYSDFISKNRCNNITLKEEALFLLLQYGVISSIQFNKRNTYLELITTFINQTPSEKSVKSFRSKIVSLVNLDYQKQELLEEDALKKQHFELQVGLEDLEFGNFVNEIYIQSKNLV